MNRKTLNLLIGVLLAVVFGLWLFVFKVRQQEIALVTTFGKPAGAPIDKPGAYLKWPWPIQRVHTFDRRIQNVEDSLSESPTADQYSLLSMVYLGWQIKDPAAFYPKFASSSITEPERGSIAQAERQLENMLRSAKGAVIGKHPLSDFISPNPSQFKFEAIEAEMLASIQGMVQSNNYGIELKYLGIKKLELAQSTTEEVFKAMQADRNVLVNRIQADGAAEVAAINTAARADSQRMLADADAKAKLIQGQGQAQAINYLRVFEQEPKLANFLLQIQALKSVLGSKATLILGPQTPPLNLLDPAAAEKKQP